MAAPIRTVLFDLDGTLVDNFEAIFRAYRHAQETLGTPPFTLEKVRAVVGGSVVRTTRRLFAEEHCEDALRLYHQYFPGVAFEGLKLLPGVPETLQALQARGLQLAVMTNKNDRYVRPICERAGIADFFPIMVGTNDALPLRKPEPAFTQHVLDRCQAQAESTILIGDSPFDIEAAKCLHLRAYAVATGSHRSDQLRQHSPAPDGVYANLTECTQAVFGEK